MEAGATANCAEERKRRKYAALAEAHQFEPIAVETMAVYLGRIHTKRVRAFSSVWRERPKNTI